MKNRCIIIAGSPVFSSIETTPEDFIVACDSGYAHAVNAGIAPDLLIGDFDSYTGEIDKTITVIRTPAEKDDTDTLLAVKQALALGYTNFILLGALGGRLDHQTANISAAAFIASQGGLCEISDESCHIYAFMNRKLQIEKQEQRSVSVFSFTDKSFGVTLTGLKYPLNNATLANTLSIGVSNEFAEDTATVEVKDGILLVVLSKLE